MPHNDFVRDSRAALNLVEVPQAHVVLTASEEVAARLKLCKSRYRSGRGWQAQRRDGEAVADVVYLDARVAAADGDLLTRRRPGGLRLPERTITER